jgi:hypothetical protein
VAQCQCSDLLSSAVEKRVRTEDESTGIEFDQLGERIVDIKIAACFQDMDFEPKGAGGCLYIIE